MYFHISTFLNTPIPSPFEHSNIVRGNGTQDLVRAFVISKVEGLIVRPCELRPRDGALY